MASGSQLSSVKCPLCNFYALSIQLVLSHLRLVHSSDPNFNVMCGISGCYKTSESFSALYQHIYKKHKDEGIIKSRTTLSTVRPVDSSDLFPGTSSGLFLDDEIGTSLGYRPGLYIDNIACLYESFLF